MSAMNPRTAPPLAALPLAALIALAGWAPPALAVDGDVEAGRGIAERHCARCHAIAASGDSPLPDAPPFRGFADRWPLEYLEESLAEGIVVGHGDVPMPEFVFDPVEIGDLLAYIGSISDQ